MLSDSRVWEECLFDILNVDQMFGLVLMWINCPHRRKLPQFMTATRRQLRRSQTLPIDLDIDSLRDVPGLKVPSREKTWLRPQRRLRMAPHKIDPLIPLLEICDPAGSFELI